MPLSVEELEQLLSEHQHRLNLLRKSHLECGEEPKRKELEQVVAACDQLVQHLETEIETAKRDGR